MGQVVYLTGAPATGKSTLCSHLAKAVQRVVVFSYSEELRKLVQRRTGTALTEDTIREKSAAVVTAADVAALDEELIARVSSERANVHFVIDSHPVTKELFGFRVTGFSVPQLQRLAPDAIVCLYTTPEIIAARIAASPMGRPSVTAFEAAMHVQLQASVAAQYGVLLGKPVYLMDSSASEVELAARVAERAKLQ